MQTSVSLIAFLLPGVLVAYWVVGDWARERTMRRRWVAQRLLSDAIKRPAAPIVKRRNEVVE
jgi:hypothetical protein